MENREMRERIVNVIKEKHRLTVVFKDNLYEFIRDNIDRNVSKKLEKEDLVAIAENYLSPETLDKFFVLERFGLSKGDLSRSLNATDSTIKKLIDDGQVRQLDTIRIMGEGYNGRMYIYSIPDILDLERKGLIQHRGEVHIRDFEPTDENIAQALYLASKSAKGTVKKSLFDLKDAAIQKLTEEERIKNEGFASYALDSKNNMTLIEALKLLERYTEN